MDSIATPRSYSLQWWQAALKNAKLMEDKEEEKRIKAIISLMTKPIAKAA